MGGMSWSEERQYGSCWKCYKMAKAEIWGEVHRPFYDEQELDEEEI
jgi:hypothetical protein